jgi:hypothetical protein
MRTTLTTSVRQGLPKTLAHAGRISALALRAIVPAVALLLLLLALPHAAKAPPTPDEPVSLIPLPVTIKVKQTPTCKDPLLKLTVSYAPLPQGVTLDPRAVNLTVTVLPNEGRFSLATNEIAFKETMRGSVDTEHVYHPKKGAYLEIVEIDYKLKGYVDGKAYCSFDVMPCKFSLKFKYHEDWHASDPSGSNPTWHIESTITGTGYFHVDDGGGVATERVPLAGDLEVEGSQTQEDSADLVTIEPNKGKGTFQIVGSLKLGTEPRLELKLVGPQFLGSGFTVSAAGQRYPCGPTGLPLFAGIEAKYVGKPMLFSLDGETKRFSGPADTSVYPTPAWTASATEDGEITVEPVEEGTTPLPTS